MSVKLSKGTIQVEGGMILGSDGKAREGFAAVPDAEIVLGSWPLGHGDPLSIRATLFATTTAPTAFFAEVWFVGDRLGRALYGAFRVDPPGGTWDPALLGDLERNIHQRLFHPREKAR